MRSIPGSSANARCSSTMPVASLLVQSSFWSLTCSMCSCAVVNVLSQSQVAHLFPTFQAHVLNCTDWLNANVSLVLMLEVFHKSPDEQGVRVSVVCSRPFSKTAA